MGQMLKRRRDHDSKTRLQPIEVAIFDRDIELIQALAHVLSVDGDASVRLRSAISEILLSRDEVADEFVMLDTLPVSDRDMH